MAIQTGDKVRCNGRNGTVESVSTFCVSGEVAGYYIRWHKSNGEIGKRTNWVGRIGPDEKLPEVVKL
jgi:hypothetical protein